MELDKCSPSLPPPPLPSPIKGGGIYRVIRQALRGDFTEPVNSIFMASQKVGESHSVHGSIPLRRAQGGERRRTAHHERKIQIAKAYPVRSP